MRPSTGAQLRGEICRPMKRLLPEEKRKFRKQKIRLQRLKQNSRHYRKKKAICRASWTLTRTRSLLCKSESKKLRKRPNLRQVQLLPHQRNYRRNSMRLAISSIARKRKKFSCPRKFKLLRSAQRSPRKRKDAAKQALENQACAAMFLPSIRRTILWS